ncbi:MAG: transposase [Pseudomonadales bacterium]|nr:transposase [Pseudomonadales bacterium]
MSRPVRIEYPGAHYHVTSKGQAVKKQGNHKPVFLDVEDRAIFINVLESVVLRFGWRLHAFVMLDSHYHLVVECPQANLSKGMRQLNGVYTQHFNRRHQQEGSLFQGRFKSILFEAEIYLLPLCRHVVLNPVRVGASSSAQTYRWSSHRAMSGAIKCPDYLYTDSVLKFFGKRKKDRQMKYRDYIKATDDSGSPLLNRSNQVLLGSAKFIGEMQPILNGEKMAKRGPSQARRRRSLPILFKNVANKPRSERNVLIIKAHIEHSYTLMEIGDHLGLHYTTVSKVVNQ